MQAIRTRYHGCTNTKPSRISAKCQAGTIYVSYDHSLNGDGNHRAACKALLALMKWEAPYYTEMVGGCFDGDWYWVFTGMCSPKTSD